MTQPDSQQTGPGAEDVQAQQTPAMPEAAPEAGGPQTQQANDAQLTPTPDMLEIDLRRRARAEEAARQAAAADYDASGRRRYRGSSGDPIFGFLLAVAVSIGLTPAPILPDNADLRYTLAWGTLAVVGVLAWLLGDAERIGQEEPENIAWGIGMGVLLGTPFILFLSDTFAAAAGYVFRDMGAGTLLAYLVFVMPLAETLFFRGVLQQQLNFWLVGLLGGLWSVVLFFPVMWQQVLLAPIVALFLAVALLTMNLMYSYVRERNGLAAAWICQIVANLIMFGLPYILV